MELALTPTWYTIALRRVARLMEDAATALERPAPVLQVEPSNDMSYLLQHPDEMIAEMRARVLARYY